MDLFRADPTTNPLADRLRPRRFDEVHGQDHLCAPGAAFRTMVDAGKLTSAILWGPPGVGKTTLARLVAEVASYRFVPFSAVLSGVKEVRAVMEEAARERAMHGRQTLVFVDEIHRFNKAQQDAFLPRVESGDIILLGATTENPSFEVNAALLSRCAVFVLRSLAPEAVRGLLERALVDHEHGLGGTGVAADEGVLEGLVSHADGDARRALCALEMLVAATPEAADGTRRLTVEAASSVLHKRLAHDKGGDRHYDLASALIKSIRNSDPDAAVYWLARLLEGGEPPNFVARRLVISAAEDIGLADPHALTLAIAAQQAAHFVGMPEARLPLTQATLYLAMADKSGSVLATYRRVHDDLQQRPSEPVPMQLRNAATSLMRELHHGQGYRNAHDDPDAHEMPCLPDSLIGRRYYEPTAAEREDRLHSRWRKRRRGRDS